MTTLDWLDTVTQLSAEWPSSKAKFALDRWRQRFIHLPRQTMRLTIERYADEHPTAPTVNALAMMLPRGCAPKRGHNGHQHLFERVADAIICHTCGDHESAVCPCVDCACRHSRAQAGPGSEGDWWRCTHCHAWALTPAVRRSA